MRPIELYILMYIFIKKESKRDKIGSDRFVYYRNNEGDGLQHMIPIDLQYFDNNHFKEIYHSYLNRI